MKALHKRDLCHKKKEKGRLVRSEIQSKREELNIVQMDTERIREMWFYVRSYQSQ